MQYARDTQYELGNGRVKFSAVLRYHLVAARHSAHLCGEHRTACILEALVWPEDRLFAHDPLAAHFLHILIGIGNNPMTTDQLDSGIAFIGYGDGISENEAIIGLIRLLGLIVHFGGDFYSELIVFFHRGITHHFVRYDKADGDLNFKSKVSPNVRLKLIVMSLTLSKVTKIRSQS